MPLIFSESQAPNLFNGVCSWGHSPQEIRPSKGLVSWGVCGIGGALRFP